MKPAAARKRCPWFSPYALELAYPLWASLFWRRANRAKWPNRGRNVHNIIETSGDIIVRAMQSAMHLDGGDLRTAFAEVALCRKHGEAVA